MQPPTSVRPALAGHLAADRLSGVRHQWRDVVQQTPAADRPAALTAAVQHTFSGPGRFAPGRLLERDLLEGLDPRERVLVQTARQALVEDLQALQCVGPDGTPRTLSPQVLHLSVGRAHQILLALRLGGEDERLTGYVRGVLLRLLEQQAFALVSAHAAAASPAGWGGIAAACAVSAGPTGTTADLTDWPALLATLQWPGTKQELADLAKTAQTIASQTEQLGQQMGTQLDQLERLTTPYFPGVQPQLPVRPLQGPLSRPSAEPMPGAEGVDPATTVPGRPINLRLLVGFLASGRGQDDAGRVRGILEQLRALQVLQLAPQRARPVAGRLGEPGATRELMEHLATLTQQLRQERMVHRKVEHLWRALEEQIKRQQRPGKDGAPGPRPVVPLPRLEAVDARSLYLQEAMLQGLPLGVALAELHDSDELTMGSSERQWFERLAMYSARRHAADLAASVHTQVNQISQNPTTVEHVRTLLRQIEVEVRIEAATKQLTDPQLETLALQRIRALRHDGVRRDDIETVLAEPEDGSPGLVDEMLLRLRADQEVRLLTAWLTLEQPLQASTVGQLRQLPHTRTFARIQEGGRKFWSRTARNGQSLYELEQDTRGRWLRYRQEAPAYRDVRPLQIPGGEDEVATHNPLGLRPIQPAKPPQRFEPDRHSQGRGPGSPKSDAWASPPTGPGGGQRGGGSPRRT